MPEEQILRLSDAFGDKKDKTDVELTVRIYNINYGHNPALSNAIDYCIEHGILEDILKKKRSEVLGMLLEEFDVEKYERSLKREGREEGLRIMVETLQEIGQTREYIVNKVAEKFSISEKEAELKVEKYWEL